jgi:preprotein translocase subunit SecG
MSLFVIVLHVVVCVALILIVLLQTGKGADMGAAFGGGASQTLFGTTGASTFLTKMTTAAAVIFMLTSLVLAYMSGNRSGGSSVLEQAPQAPIEQQAPQSETTPAPTAPATESETAQPQAQPQEADQAPAAQDASSTPAAGPPATDQGNDKKGTSE